MCKAIPSRIYDQMLHSLNTGVPHFLSKFHSTGLTPLAASDASHSGLQELQHLVELSLWSERSESALRKKFTPQMYNIVTYKKCRCISTNSNGSSHIIIKYPHHQRRLSPKLQNLNQLQCQVGFICEQIFDQHHNFPIMSSNYAITVC